MTPRGRPQIGRPLTIRIRDHTRKRLEELAAERGVKLADVAREILEHATNTERTDP